MAKKTPNRTATRSAENPVATKKLTRKEELQKANENLADVIKKLADQGRAVINDANKTIQKINERIGAATKQIDVNSGAIQILTEIEESDESKSD